MALARTAQPILTCTRLVFATACVSTPPSRVDTATLQAAIKAQADAWDAAIVKQDRAAIVANMHPDFMNIDSNGAVLDAQQFVAELVDPKLRIDPYTVEDFRVRVHGDAVITTGVTHMTGRYEGTPFKSHYRFTHAYVRDGNHWKVVQVQTTQAKE